MIPVSGLEGGQNMNNYIKLISQRYPNVILRVIPGHFATPNAHVNYYMDMSPMKARTSESRAVAQALAESHISSTPVDTIVCMEGMEVIGAFLAEELQKAGILSMNQHKSIYVLTPEHSVGGQLIFRENLLGWIKNKNVLLLFDSATSGHTVRRAVDTLKYYGAIISGISAIFSAASKIGGMEVHALYTLADLPDYKFYHPEDCKLCKDGVKIDAICSGMGYTPLP